MLSMRDLRQAGIGQLWRGQLKGSRAFFSAFQGSKAFSTSLHFLLDVNNKILIDKVWQ